MGLNFRRELEARFGELPEAVWQELVRRGYADAYELAADEQEAQEAFDAAVAYLRRRGIRPRALRGEPSTITLFSPHALSRAFVAVQWGDLQYVLNAPEDSLTMRERALRDAIQGFRAEFLPDGAIPEDSIREWLQQHQQHAPTYWAKVALREVGGKVPLVEYNGYVYRVASELFRAVQELRRETGWTESQCLRFLLSDSMPEGLPIQMSVDFGLSTGTTFINLRLPAFLEPETVAQLYRMVQKRVYAHHKRLRGIQKRTAELIRFVEVYRARHPKARWREVAKAWNDHCIRAGRPQWQVSESMLKRHYERYIRTVLDLVQGSPAGMFPAGDG